MRAGSLYVRAVIRENKKRPWHVLWAFCFTVVSEGCFKYCTWVSFAREQPVAFKACLLRAQRRFHATGYTRAGRVDARATHDCRVERARIGVCCRILPARGLWRALFVVPPCRAPASRAAYLTDIPFHVRRVPSKAMPVTGFGNSSKKEHVAGYPD